MSYVYHTKWHKNIAENFNRLSRVHERYRQTTDGRTTTYSEREREREFTFAINDSYIQGESCRPTVSKQFVSSLVHDHDIHCFVAATLRVSTNPA